ncbi:MAG: type II toxin-antitoxin system Phd/YefM family antitoxin [Candidatus Scalinduaceae bacterium]
MKTVGSYEAKTHLPRLLEEVANGEKIIITKHGVAVAMLVSVQSKQKQDPKVVIQEIRSFRQGRSLKGLSIREMIEEGRRF